MKHTQEHVHHFGGFGRTTCGVSTLKTQVTIKDDEVTCPACLRVMKREAQRLH
jgi:hypothetical protein